MAEIELPNDFIQLFRFADDLSKPGRALSSVKIGEVFMTRVIVDPGVTTGNYYHKETRVMFYVGSGRIYGAFENVNTKERKEMELLIERDVVHVPKYVAMATRNIGKEKAVMVFFSNRALRSEDSFEYKVL